MKMNRTLVAMSMASLLLLNPVYANAATKPTQIAFESDDNVSKALTTDKLIATVIVEDANLNVRKGPSTNDAIIGKLKNGDQVEVLAELDDWIQISYKNSVAYLYKTYVMLSRISTAQPAPEQAKPALPADEWATGEMQPMPDWLNMLPAPGREEATAPGEQQLVEKKIGTITVENANLNVRKGPSLADDVIGKLQGGNQVEILEESDEWVKIPYQGGIAYLAKTYVSISKVMVNSAQQKRRIIVLDPGHGGKDSGAKAKDGTYESTITWKYTTKAKEMLEKAGYQVFLTRTEKGTCTTYKTAQEELACRSAIPAQVGADIYIAIHADANPNKNFRGTVTFYNARNDYDGRQNPYPENSRLLASLIHEQVQPAMGSKDRGFQNQNYYVNRMNSVPSVLIELAVMTNTTDLAILKNNNQPSIFANALVKAVNQYYQL